ncbi:hypothetical protein BJV74DRAFT_79906 [Russula compacta]|nr:hypothetical protein BJV74DRAFT_79906 [Russula compacta]
MRPTSPPPFRHFLRLCPSGWHHIHFAAASFYACENLSCPFFSSRLCFPCITVCVSPTYTSAVPSTISFSPSPGPTPVLCTCLYYCLFALTIRYSATTILSSPATFFSYAAGSKLMPFQDSPFKMKGKDWFSANLKMSESIF